MRMNELTQADIAKLGELARIGVPAAIAETLAPQLGEILSYVAQLQNVDTGDTTTTSQVTGLTDVWREDEVRPCGIPPERLLQNAPEVQDGYIKVKRVL